MQNEIVLLYAVKEDKAGKIKKLMKKQNVAVKVVAVSMYGQAVGKIALGGGISKQNTSMSGNLSKNSAGNNTRQGLKIGSPVFGTNVMGEMMVFSGISSERMDVLLAELKQSGIQIPLKAVITMYNFNWTGYELYRELQKERESF